MPNDRPLLTVGIPTYNSAHFLPDSLGSVIRQGLDDYEIVVIDNASQDNTEEIVHSFKDDRIRYFRNETNLGSRENHNRCLSEARGVYFKFLCADDVLLDGVLAKQMSVLSSNPDVTLVSCNISVTDATLHRGKSHAFLPGACSGSRVINVCLTRMSNYIGGPSNFMFRLADAEGITLDPSYHFVSDLKLGLQLLERGNYVNIDEVGYLYRRHAASDTEVGCPPNIRVPEFLRLLESFGSWNPLTCMEALRRGGAEGRSAVLRNWRTACRPANIMKAFRAVPDILRMWEF